MIAFKKPAALFYTMHIESMESIFFSFFLAKKKNSLFLLRPKCEKLLRPEMVHLSLSLTNKLKEVLLVVQFLIQNTNIVSLVLSG